MKNIAIAFMLAAITSQTALAEPIKKCVIKGQVVYSDNLCEEQGTEIDTLNATPPTLADRQAAEMRSRNARREEAEKAAKIARTKARDANCDYTAKNVAQTVTMARRDPKNQQLQSAASYAVTRLNRDCPNHTIFLP